LATPARTRAEYLTCACALALVAQVGAAVTQQPSAPRTVADGVYTKEQAERGRNGYTVYCENCHAADLAGTNSGDSGAPPLKRDGFMLGSDAGGLFTKIQETMPLDAPASLKDSDYADILAFIFQENGFPAGTVALPADRQQLGTIRIVRAQPVP
jgi:mono/diheme cytochrome c family protein